MACGKARTKKFTFLIKPNTQMTPINFPETNRIMRGDHLTIAAHQVGNLRVYQGEGQFISKWKMSWRERLHALIFGTCWLQMYCMSFPPVSLSAQKDIFTKGDNNNEKKN
jgi:hypothetical protein